MTDSEFTLIRATNNTGPITMGTTGTATTITWMNIGGTDGSCGTGTIILSILPMSARPPNTQFNSGKIFSGADHTITWRPWQQKPKDEFRFRTGDRYLGHAVLEQYLGFAQVRTSSKAIKLSMIRLGNEHVREEVVIRPGIRYAIVKITNHTMTARKGVWSWTPQ
jgi:hypothetical protein